MEKKTKKKWKMNYVNYIRKQLKMSQNILKILWCIEHAFINIQSKLHVLTVNCFRVALKTKNSFCLKIPVFILFFTVVLKTSGKFLLLTPL